jgi:hypothetical protein
MGEKLGSPFDCISSAGFVLTIILETTLSAAGAAELLFCLFAFREVSMFERLAGTLFIVKEYGHVAEGAAYQWYTPYR